VPVLALFLQLMYFRRYPYMLCQLILATHWFAFLLLFFGVALPVFMVVFRLQGLPMLILILFMLIPYTYLALRQFYRENHWWTTTKTTAFLAVFSITYLMYRSFILWVTFVLV